MPDTTRYEIALREGVHFESEVVTADTVSTSERKQTVIVNAYGVIVHWGNDCWDFYPHHRIERIRTWKVR